MMEICVHIKLECTNNDLAYHELNFILQIKITQLRIARDFLILTLCATETTSTGSNKHDGLKSAMNKPKIDERDVVWEKLNFLTFQRIVNV